MVAPLRKAAPMEQSGDHVLLAPLYYPQEIDIIRQTRRRCRELLRDSPSRGGQPHYSRSEARLTVKAERAGITMASLLKRPPTSAPKGHRNEGRPVQAREL